MGLSPSENDMRSLSCFPLSAQCYKSLARGELGGQHMKKYILHSSSNWLRIQTDVFNEMQLSWWVVRLCSKRKEGDLLHRSPTWFERAYQSLDSVILTIQIALSVSQIKKSYFPPSCLFTSVQRVDAAHVTRMDAFRGAQWWNYQDSSLCRPVIAGRHKQRVLTKPAILGAPFNRGLHGAS